MSGPWWGKDVAAERATRAAELAGGGLPALTESDPERIGAEIDARRAGFTPTWTSRGAQDAGVALIKVYAEQHAVVAAAVKELTTKARVEQLRAAGVVQRPPRPLVTTLQFEVSPAATAGVALGEGFAVLGRDAAGALVQFETERSILAVPATLSVVARRSAGRLMTLTPPSATSSPIHPFGLDPGAGAALYLGLDAAIAPGPELTLGFRLAPGDVPGPVSAGGLFPAPGAEPPRLSWELFDAGNFVPAELRRDETRSFTRSGVVELRVSSSWRRGVPPGADPKQPLYWLRAQLLDGAWPAAPALAFVGLNVVQARSGRTVIDEVVETPLSPEAAVRRVLRLAEAPVLEGTLDVRIDEGGARRERWQAVDDLGQAGPDARVFQLDAATGSLTFAAEASGHGRPLPEGFRHVRATYRLAVSGGSVAAGAVSTLVGSAPFINGVVNLDAAAGGVESESLDAALLRGPREIRARGRAVAVADYELLALSAPGADIRRAQAVGGYHPRFPGRSVPGVIGVFVVGGARSDGAPPVPTEASLRLVSEHLAARGPRGGEVIAAVPEFLSVRVEASVQLAQRVDVTRSLHDLSLALDRWFDPVLGGARRQGWQFGGAIGYHELIRFALRELSGAIVAIPQLRLVVNGVRSRRCEDVAIPPHTLLWPAAHELVALPRRAT
jgi:predicted phage baseplate assembly protein